MKTIDLHADDTNVPSAHPDAYKTRLREYIILALLIALCAAISIFGLFKQSLRLDEAQSLWQTSHSISTILHIVAQDVHTPFYHLLLHGWEKLFGITVATTRALSLIFFLASIPLAYILGNESYGRRVGLFGATLVALSPFLNWYGSETRMYSLLVLLTLANQIFFLRIFRKGTTTSWVGYFITALLGIYTHYFFFFALITQAIFFVLYRELFPRGSFKNALITTGGLAFLFAPWIGYVFRLGFASTTQPMLGKPTAYNLFDTVGSFVFGFQGNDFTRIALSLWPLIMLLFLLGLRRDRRSGERRRIPAHTTYFLMAGILPMVFVFLISFIKPSYLSRYLIFSIPSFYLFLGWVLNLYPQTLAKAARSILISIMLVTLAIQTTNAASPLKEDYRAAVDYMESNAAAQDIVLVAAPFTIYPIEYYYQGQAKLQTIPEWNQYASGTLPQYTPEKIQQQVDIIKKSYSTAWVLLSVDQGYNEDIRRYFDNSFQRIQTKNFSPGLNLYAYKLRY